MAEGVRYDEPLRGVKKTYMPFVVFLVFSCFPDGIRLN